MVLGRCGVYILSKIHKHPASTSALKIESDTAYKLESPSARYILITHYLLQYGTANSKHMTSVFKAKEGREEQG